MDANDTRVVDKYLSRHAEHSTQWAERLGRYRHFVAIPAHGEGTCLDAAVQSIPPGDGAVLIVVVLNVHAHSPMSVRCAHLETLTRLRQLYPQRWSHQEMSLHEHSAGDLALLEVTLPEGQGVGLARKIGGDLGLALWRQHKLDSNWLHGTDADVRLPQSYWRVCRDIQGASALTYPFAHEPAPDALLREAILRYEISLRHFVLGLRHAKSPYAFHTIGSTIAVDARAYAEVRGVPRRQAGEDFYLLNKLAKLGPIATAESDPIVLAGRVSDRVPFGTGRAMLDAPRSLPRCYHPETFERLRIALAACFTPEGGDLSPRPWRQRANELGGDPDWYAPVETMGIDAILERLRTQCHAPASRVRGLHQAIDGFVTRKLIHAWRDRDLPSLPVERCHELYGGRQAATLEEICASLARAELGSG